MPPATGEHEEESGPITERTPETREGRGQTERPPPATPRSLNSTEVLDEGEEQPPPSTQPPETPRLRGE